MTWPLARTPASSATPLHRVGSAIRAIAVAFRPRSVDMHGPARFTSQRAKRDEQRLSAQADTIRNLTALSRRKSALLIEAEILRAEIKEAKRMHSPVCSTERELRLVVTELLSIG